MKAGKERALYDLLQVIAVISAADGPLPERLGSAYWEHLTETRFDDFPEHQRIEFQAVQRELRRAFPEPGRYAQVTYMQAFELARRILCAYDKVFTEELLASTG